MLHFTGVNNAGIGTLLVIMLITLFGFLFAVVVCAMAGEDDANA